MTERNWWPPLKNVPGTPMPVVVEFVIVVIVFVAVVIVVFVIVAFSLSNAVGSS